MLGAGTVGAATYANAAAVSSYLMTSYANVTANYASGTVSVPVTSWTNTDNYNPTVAGSYTFTAVLGTLPAGYANTGAFTASVEVVLSTSEITSFAAISNVSAGTVGAATYANAAAVSSYLMTSYANVTANYAGGTVSVPVTSWTNTDNYSSAVAGSYTFTAVLGTLPAGYANTGAFTASVEVVLSTSEITGFAAISNVSAGAAGSATYADAAAVSSHLLTSYANVTANYASGTVSVPVTSWTNTDNYNPTVAGSYTFTAVLGTLPAGYANAGAFTSTIEVVVSSALTPTLTITPSGANPNLRTVEYIDGGTTYNLIRGLNPKSVTVNTFVAQLGVTNGTMKLYKWSPSAGYAEVIASDNTTVVGTNFRVELYDASNNLSTTYYVAIMGELNGSGTINNTDTAFVRGHVSGITTITDAIQLYVADIDNNGTVNEADITALRNSISKKGTITQ